MTVLAFAYRIFMTTDRPHVIIRGKYIGTEKPGSWANIFRKMKIDVFQIRPTIYYFRDKVDYYFSDIVGQSRVDLHIWNYNFILTLWHIKVGPLISIITNSLLLIF